MNRIYFLTPGYRRREPEMFLVIMNAPHPNMFQVRAVYRLLRKSGYRPARARWSVYDLMSMPASRHGAGYGI